MEFTRPVARHEAAARTVEVVSVEQATPTIRRIRFEGPDLLDFPETGPADHVKVCFPDPATGVLYSPVRAADGTIDRQRSGVMISRDYTPLARDGETITLEFVMHGDGGPASNWAAQAAPGQILTLLGPRGSRYAPELDDLVLIVDETAFPAASRWIEAVDAPVTIIAFADESDYFGDRSVEWVEPYELEGSVRSLEIASGTFVFAAGEAGALVPIRRYLRHGLGLPPEQVSISGYWRRGVVNLDHHAPLDPSDPD
jgi:NADPH-dependent ferric siderophore reductase